MPVDSNAVGNAGCCNCGAPPPLLCSPIPGTCSLCGSSSLPGSIALTDGFGTTNLIWDRTSSAYLTCVTANTGNCITGCDASCLGYTIGGGTIAIAYKLTCAPWTLTRTFGFVSWLDQCTPQADNLAYCPSVCSGNSVSYPVICARTGLPIQPSNSCSDHINSFAPTSCNPFSYSGTFVAAGGCPMTNPSGSMAVSLSAPLVSPATYCENFKITGCNGLALPGVTVSVYDTSGGTLLTSGTTDSGGNCVLIWSSGSSTAYVTATDGSGRFTAAGQAFTASTSLQIGLTVAAGYSCISGCVYPVSNTLHFTSVLFGNFTLVNVGGMTWATSGPHFVSTIAFCGCTAVAACPFGITFSGASHAIGMQWDIANAPPAPNGCPSTSGPAPGTSGTATIACPPSFSASLTVVGAATCTSGINMNYTAAMFGPGGTDTWMITE